MSLLGAIKCLIPQLGTCSIENVWRATVQYGAVLNCPYCTLPEGMNFTCKHVFGLDAVVWVRD